MENQKQELKLRQQVSLGEKELRVMDEIQKKKPEWRFYNTSEKAKVLFWEGAKKYLEELRIYSFPKSTT